MDTLPGCYENLDRPPNNPDGYQQTWSGQQALCACALTCRAWRVRAQHLLSTFPHILDDARLSPFTTAVQESPITGLTLGDYYFGRFDTSKASELFMHSSLRLQHWRCIKVDFDRGPPLRLLRMRLPFFASIVTLQLWSCTFQSLRAMLDVVWACPNLSGLDISYTKFEVKCVSLAALRQMSAAVEHLRACEKLTSLHIEWSTLLASSYLPSLDARPLMIYCLHRQPGTSLVSDLRMG